jgi:protein O-GlcNAc transferase
MALTVDPNCINAFYNKALTLSDLGRHQEAIEYYDKVLAIEPNSVDAPNNKAKALASL